MVHFHGEILGQSGRRPPCRTDRHRRPPRPHRRCAAVRTGRLAPGTRLPSSRTLAADLGIARNTVADAYADLVAEGWLTARQGSGTRVAEHAVVPPADTTPPRRLRGRPTYDLVPGTPDLAAFPRTEWLKAARRAFTAAPYQALGYGDPEAASNSAPPSPPTSPASAASAPTPSTS